MAAGMEMQPVIPANERARLLREYRARQQQQSEIPPPPPAPGAAPRAALNLPAARPDFARLNRWTPLGPAVVKAIVNGQPTGYSGRTPALAVAPGGQRLYAASANGGVWRSEDAGHSWVSLMDAFDLNPTAFRSDSLACGAIALVAGGHVGQDVLYIGSGEAHESGDAYYGVGPIVSLDGGTNWYSEMSEPSLVGKGFFALAVNPVQPAQVVAATSAGLYRREIQRPGSNEYIWRQKLDGSFSSVVSTHSNGVTVYYAARQYGGVYRSSDGERWEALGKKFPSDGVGRIGLAVQPDNPNILYALIATNSAQYAPNGSLLKAMYQLHGLYRLDVNEGTWHSVKGIPDTLFGFDLFQAGQGWYDLAMAVAPDDPNRIYIGGSTTRSDGVRGGVNYGEWAASLYRCEITLDAKQNASAKATYIGGSVHADIHALVFAPGDANQLWVGCDGGVFYSNKPTADPLAPANKRGLFEPRNAGLSTMTMNFFAQNAAEEAVIFCGTQDNGAQRYTGEEVWMLSAGGDGGYCAINARDPYTVLSTYTFGSINRSRDGGATTAYSEISVPIDNEEYWDTLFYAPLASAPYDPNNPASADLIAFGSSRVWISERFGGNLWWKQGDPYQNEVDWRSIPSGVRQQDRLSGGAVRALAFASPSKLYAGTTGGSLHRFDKQGNRWHRTDLPPIENIAGLVTCIAVDPVDTSGNSIYITLGGYGVGDRLWRFNGTGWEARSGPKNDANLRLLDVQHNAVLVDRFNPNILYAAADIGIWRSLDSGRRWEAFSAGLPDAAVLDLQQHPLSGALRAATHGRGIYEFQLYTPQQAVELYVRDHQLDRGRPRQTPLDRALHPLRVGQGVQVGDSPDIKIETLDAAGDYPSGNGVIDFFAFAARLDETPAPATLWTHDAASLINRVYVQVHNFGFNSASRVRVSLLLAKTDAALPELPNGYERQLHDGIPVENSLWRTAGYVDVYNLRNDQPKIARFDLNSDWLPPASQLAGNDRYCLAVVVQSLEDAFVPSAPTMLDRNDRKVATKYVQVQPYTGILKPPIVVRSGSTTPPQEFIASHKVKARETLSSVAKKYYGAMQQWPEIYRANQAVIGNNPNLLRVGMVLKIPKL